MKSKFLALAAALLMLGYGSPRTFAQDSTKPASQDPGQTANQSDKNSGPPLANPADPEKVKHDGGKEDVDAIGNRNVGCKRMGNWYGVGNRSPWAKHTPCRSSQRQDGPGPVVTEYVNRIGQNLVRNSDAQVPLPSR